MGLKDALILGVGFVGLKNLSSFTSMQSNHTSMQTSLTSVEVLKDLLLLDNTPHHSIKNFYEYIKAFLLNPVFDDLCQKRFMCDNGYINIIANKDLMYHISNVAFYNYTLKGLDKLSGWSATKLDRIRLVDMSFGNEYDSGFFKPLGKLILDNHKISIDIRSKFYNKHTKFDLF